MKYLLSTIYFSGLSDFGFLQATGEKKDSHVFLPINHPSHVSFLVLSCLSSFTVYLYRH